MTNLIYLGHSRWSIVDDEDYARLEEAKLVWSWHAVFLSTGTYAARNIKRSGKTIAIYLHRYILDAPDDMDVDHRDGNGLNNRRANLRLATRSQNMANIPINSDRLPPSGYKGVYKNGKKWMARISNYPTTKLSYLGQFSCKEDAARAYNKAALERYGEFAVLNEIPTC